MLVGGGLAVWTIAGAEAAVGLLTGGASIVASAVTTAGISLVAFSSN